MEHFWDLLFQLMKHGTNTLHIAFIFLFSFSINLAWLKGKQRSLSLQKCNNLIEWVEEEGSMKAH